MIKKLFLLCLICVFGFADKCHNQLVFESVAIAINAIDKVEVDDTDKAVWRDIYCKDSMVTYIYDVDDDELKEALLDLDTKKEFDKNVQDEILNVYCTNNLLTVYREAGVGIKWRYFFKGDSKPFGEYSADNSSCKAK